MSQISLLWTHRSSKTYWIQSPYPKHKPLISLIWQLTWTFWMKELTKIRSYIDSLSAFQMKAPMLNGANSIETCSKIICRKGMVKNWVIEWYYSSTRILAYCCVHLSISSLKCLKTSLEVGLPCGKNLHSMSSISQIMKDCASMICFRS